MEASFAEVYAEACRALGETIVELRIVSRRLQEAQPEEPDDGP